MGKSGGSKEKLKRVTGDGPEKTSVVEWRTGGSTKWHVDFGLWIMMARRERIRMRRGREENYSNLLRSLVQQRTSENFRWPNNKIRNVKRPKDGWTLMPWCMGGRTDRPFQLGPPRFLLLLLALAPQVVAQMHAGRSAGPNKFPLQSHRGLKETQIDLGCWGPRISERPLSMWMMWAYIDMGVRHRSQPFCNNSS